MSAANPKVPVTLGSCRCCGGIKRCRVLNVEYEWQGQKEVYSDMFVDCFGLLLSHFDGGAAKHMICLTCVLQLRKAVNFRRQVLKCEEQLLKTSIHVHYDDTLSKVIVKEEKKELNVEETQIKTISVAEQHPRLEAMVVSNVNTEMDCDNGGSDVKVEENEMKMEKDPTIHPANAQQTQDDDVGDDADRNDDDDNTSLASLQKETNLLKKSSTTKPNSKLTPSKLHKKRKRKIDDDPASQPKSRLKYIETLQKNYSNTVAIVENSYVCPFTTSFSDFYCTYCKQQFTDASKLRTHTMEHDPTTFKTFYDNKKIAQVDITQIDCRLCPIKIDNIDILKEHLQKVHNKFIYIVTNEFLKFKLTLTNLTCIECEATFKFFHALRKHMAVHFGRCICDACGVNFFDKKSLVIHQKVHRPVKELFPCKDCGKTFKFRNEMNLHERRIHRKEAAYPCSKCNEAFFTYPLRYRHLINFHGEDRKFPCDSCGKVYNSIKSLREHNKKSHLKIMKHQCELCERRFYQPSRLKEHLSTHTGERNYRCDLCGKSFPRLRGLKVHMQGHSVVKMYKCVLCTASFGQNVSLKNHVKRLHKKDSDGRHSAV